MMKSLLDSIREAVMKKMGQNDSLKLYGRFNAEVHRGGRLITEVPGKNQITTVGKNHILDVTFGNSSPVTQVATWYIGLINNTPTPTLLTSDTLASHSGWSETTAYSGTRKAWDDANASSGSKGVNAVSTFTMNATVTVYGIFICSVTSGTSGTLWSAGAFASPISLVNADDLKVTYTLGF